MGIVTARMIMIMIMMMMVMVVVVAIRYKGWCSYSDDSNKNGDSWTGSYKQLKWKPKEKEEEVRKSDWLNWAITPAIVVFVIASISIGHFLD